MQRQCNTQYVDQNKAIFQAPISEDETPNISLDMDQVTQLLQSTLVPSDGSRPGAVTDEFGPEGNQNISSSNPVETYEIVQDYVAGNSYFIADENGGQLYEITSAEKLQEMLNSNEYVLVQENSNSNWIQQTDDPNSIEVIELGNSNIVPDVQTNWIQQNTTIDPPLVPVATFDVDTKNAERFRQAVDNLFGNLGIAPSTRCHICLLECETDKKLQFHLKSHEQDRPHKCHRCNVSYNHEINLLLHSALSHKSNGTAPYICPVCEKSFSRQSSFRGHLILHEVDEDLTCALCPEVFKSQCLFNRHMEDHKNGVISSTLKGWRKGMTCKLCGMMLESTGHLRQHYTQVHPKRKARNPKVIQVPVENESPSKDAVSVNTDQGKRRNRTSKQHAKDYLNNLLVNKSNEPPPKSGPVENDSVPLKKRSYVRMQYVNKSGSSGYTCGECRRTFLKKSLLLRHLVMHTKQKPFSCNLCGKQFGQKSSVKTHMLTHETVPQYHCPMCSKGFKYRNTYLQHVNSLKCTSKKNSKNRPSAPAYFKDIRPLLETIVKNKTGETGQSINILRRCLEGHFNEKKTDNAIDISDQVEKRSTLNKYFPSTSNKTAEEHKSVSKTDTQENKFNKVENVFEIIDRDSGRRTTHRLLIDENGRRIYQCSICHSHWKRAVDLSRHVRCHTDDRPFRCVECRKSFRLKSILQTHLLSHTKKGTFQCTTCSKSFSLLQTLKVHQMIHTNERRFHCNKCNNGFITSSHYKYHVRTHDTRDKKMCTKTPKGQHIEPGNSDQPIPLYWDASAQRLVSMDRPKNCPVKDNSDMLQRHCCSICQRSYKNLVHLRVHMRQQHCDFKRPVCSLCNRTFVSNSVLTTHMRNVHFQQKTIQCDLCEASFVNQAMLKRHMSLHTDARPYFCPICNKCFKTRAYCKNHISTHSIGDNQPEPQLIAIEEAVPLEYQASNFDMFPHLIDQSDEGNKTAQDSQQIVQYHVTDLTSAYHVLEDDNPPQQGFVAIQDAQNYQTTTTTTNEQLLPYSDNLDINLFTESSVVQPINTESEKSESTSYPVVQVIDVNQDNVSNQSSILVKNCPKLTEALFSGNTQNATNFPSISEADAQQMSKDLRRKPLFGCAKCDHVFKQADNLVEHVQSSHTTERPYQCSECTQNFVSQYSLHAHSYKHAPKPEGMDFKCPFPGCSSVFSGQVSLSRHVSVNHSEVQHYRCTDCGDLFQNIRDLSMHIKKLLENSEAVLIDNNGPYSGLLKRNRSNVNLVFDEGQSEEISRLKPNINMSLSEKYLIEAAKDRTVVRLPGARRNLDFSKTLYACKQCDRSFKTMFNLRRHLISHTDERPFMCNICSRKFRYKFTLKCHVETFHKSTIKCFSCHLCSRLFSSKVALKAHMRLHTNSKCFGCLHCSEQFLTTADRRRHILSVHPKEADMRKPPNTSVHTQPEDETTNAVSGTDTPVEYQVLYTANELSTPISGQQSFVYIGKDAPDMDDKETQPIDPTIVVSSWQCLNCQVIFHTESEWLDHQTQGNCNNNSDDVDIDVDVDEIVTTGKIRCSKCIETFVRQMDLESHTKKIHQRFQSS